MADRNFKVKSGLNIPITSAAILTTDVNGNISSTSVLPISAGGTGQTSATNAINALLPVQNGSTINYAIQSDGTNISWGKLYNQVIQNNGVTVNPRRTLNIVGASFTDSSTSDLTTAVFASNSYSVTSSQVYKGVYILSSGSDADGGVVNTLVDSVTDGSIYSIIDDTNTYIYDGGTV